MQHQVKRLNQVLALIVLFILVVLPLCLILYRGFAPSETSSFLENVQQIIQSSNLKILWNSVLLGLSVVILTTLIALPLSYIMVKTSLSRHQWLDVLIMVPFMTPPYIGAMGWMLTMQHNGLLHQISPIFSHLTPIFFSFFGMVVIMSCHLTPFLYVVLKKSLLNIHQSQEEAALIYGGSFMYRFKRIIAPLFVSGYSMGALLVFVKAIGEFGTPVTMGNRIGFKVLTSEIHHSASIWPIDFQRAALLSSLLLTVSMGVWAFQQWFQTRTNFISNSGKGQKTRILPKGKWDILLYLFVFIELFVTIVLPYASIVINAFVKRLSKGLTPDNITLDNFVQVLSGNGGIALFNSVLLAVIAATLASILGLWYVLSSQKRNPLSKLIDFSSLLPNTVPGIIVVIGLILFWNSKFNPIPLYNTIFMLVVTYTVLYIPYAVQNIKNVKQNISPNLFEAAEMSGSTGWQKFKSITLPLLRPGIISGWILIFCISMRELVGSLMLRPPNTDTSATFIYRQFEQGDSSQGMAMALLSIGITSIILIAMEQWERKRKL
ncbi:ABC transporter permease [Staphylococcus massiliensis]|uniref:Putative ABC transporter permease n=1 Tax=Staphylococcus massiliensis S46 TaxID=1229783 RepID=K9B8M6_9STAP|nr:iron ABC transporter permease [Staphylococcus massiliensis]EKU50130.1 putative ABC transporter permease [Staphylococcus massiliensis S46]POA00824.1 iron ABC transporter permease [Staphylococcus massiliensis CCUG 55927]